LNTDTNNKAAVTSTGNPLLLLVEAQIQASLSTLQQAAEVICEPITVAAGLLIHCLEKNHGIFSCGNGGSAADAQHFSAELLGRYLRPRLALRAMALTTDTSSLTSIANDQAYAQVFSRQLQGLGRPGDVLLAISTSGNSSSILEAVRTAHTLQMGCVLLSGGSGGKLATILRPGDVEIRVPAQATARIQEVHGLIIHCLCDLIDRNFAEEDNS